MQHDTAGERFLDLTVQKQMIGAKDQELAFPVGACINLDLDKLQNGGDHLNLIQNNQMIFMVFKLQTGVCEKGPSDPVSYFDAVF